MKSKIFGLALIALISMSACGNQNPSISSSEASSVIAESTRDAAAESEYTENVEMKESDTEVSENTSEEAESDSITTNSLSEASSSMSEASSSDPEERFEENVQNSLTDKNIDERIRELYISFADALRNGDTDTLYSMCDLITEGDRLFMSRYADVLCDTSDLSVDLLIQSESGCIARITNAAMKEMSSITSWVDIGVVESENGLILSSAFRQEHICGSCSGSGSVLSGEQVCGICGGTGQQYIPNAFYDAMMGWQGQWQACSGCAGSGYIGANTISCPDCGGIGYK